MKPLYHLLVIVRKMTKLPSWKSAILLLALTFIIQASQVRYHLNHQAAAPLIRRHQLSSPIHFRVYHNMRVFKTHQGHLNHDSTTENYGLNDMGYYFSLNVTVAGLPYRLNIDTGSSDIFIKGDQSPGSPAVKYTCQKCAKQQQTISIGYLDGYLSTYKANLPVQLGQHSFQESVLVAFTAPHNFQAAEGLVGLSFPQIARNQDPTFVQTLINNKIINQYAFGVNLNFQQHKRSFISFGTPDRDLFEGELKNYTIMPGYSYAIKVDGVSVADGPLLSISSALLDTGNTCISIPIKYESSILKEFNKNGNKCGFDNEDYAPQFSLLRCKVLHHDLLPSFKIHIGNDIYEIDHNTYMQRCIKKPDGDLCDTYIESVKYNYQLFLGDGFFSRYYAYFNLGQRQIGFAKNKEVLSYTNMYFDESNFDDQDRKYFIQLSNS